MELTVWHIDDDLCRQFASRYCNRTNHFIAETIVCDTAEESEHVCRIL